MAQHVGTVGELVGALRDDKEEELYLYAVVLSERSLAAIGAALANNANLKELWIVECGVRNVSHLLSSHTLLSLNLSTNEINDEGAKAVAEYLARPDVRLEMLILNSNDITDVGCRRICDSLVRNTSLRELHFYDNLLTDASLPFVFEALETNAVLRKIELDNGDESERNVIKDVQALKRLETVMRERREKDVLGSNGTAAQKRKPSVMPSSLAVHFGVTSTQQQPNFSPITSGRKHHLVSVEDLDAV